MLLALYHLVIGVSAQNDEKNKKILKAVFPS
jgi:hypothetical protein